QKVPSPAFIKKDMADQQCFYGKYFFAIPLPVFQVGQNFFSHRSDTFRQELIQPFSPFHSRKAANRSGTRDWSDIPRRPATSRRRLIG
ncbi:MAG: hypothetical protein R6X17_13390, partial [Candidatus Competibacteraceae bacterium]